jgi:hypothetical protein
MAVHTSIGQPLTLVAIIAVIVADIMAIGLLRALLPLPF